MGVAVGALVVAHVYGTNVEIVVVVIVGGGGQAFKVSVHILDQKWLVFVNHDTRGGVSRVKEHIALSNPTLL